MDFKRNIRYFRGVRVVGQVWMIVIGGIHFLAGYIAGGEGFFVAAIGAVLVAAGVGLIIHRKRSVISDSNYDSNVFACNADLMTCARVKTGIADSELIGVTPIALSGYNFVKANYAKKGKDNRWRSDVMESFVFYFTDKVVHCYKRYFITTIQKMEDSAEVYYYDNIVDASIVTQNTKVKKMNITYESLILTTKGGAILNIPVYDINESYEAVNTFRKAINEKKV